MHVLPDCIIICLPACLFACLPASRIGCATACISSTLQVITAHPPVLSYDVAGRLQPFWEYMASIGVPDVAAAVARRPSLLGLDVDANLRKIVDYLQVCLLALCCGALYANVSMLHAAAATRSVG